MRPLLPPLLAVISLGLAMVATAQTPHDRMQAAAEDYRRQDWGRAREKFIEVLEKSPADPASKAAWFYLGEVETQLKNLEAARSAYQNFLLLVTEHPHRELARFRLVEIGYLAGASDAVPLCEGFLKAFPQSTWRAEVLNYLGHLRLIRNEPDLAERVFATALNEYPSHANNMRVQLGYATALIRTGNPQAALPLLKEIAAASEPGLSSRAKILLALLDFESGSKQESLLQLEAMVEAKDLTSAERAEVHVWLGRIMADKNQCDHALAHYKQAIDSGLVEPWLSVALYEWTALIIRAAKPQVGLDELQRWKSNPEVLRLDRATRELVSALEVRLSFEAKRYGQTETLVAEYQARFQAGVNYRQVLEVAGRTAFLRGESQEGMRRFQELLEHPSNTADEQASYVYQLATLLVARRDYPAAKQLLYREAGSQASLGFRVQMRCLLAVVELESGKAAEARRILEELLAESEVASSEVRRPILRQLIQLAVRVDSFDVIRELWPEFLDSGALEGDDLPLLEKIGDLGYQHSDWAMATDCYRQLARSDQELERQAAGWSGLAWTALAEGKSSFAREAFEHLLELPVPEELKSHAYLPLAGLLEQEAENAESIAMYQRAILQADDPRVVALAKFKCALRIQQSGGEEVKLKARDLLAELEASPIDSVPLDQVVYRLAWIDDETGRQEDAEQRYCRFLNEFPESKLLPDVAYRLARVRLSQGKIETAAEILAAVNLEGLPVELRERLMFLNAQLAAKEGEWSQVYALMGQLVGSTADRELEVAATYWQAEASFQLARWKEASDLFAQVHATAGTQLAGAMRSQAALREAEALLANDDWRGSLQVIEQVRAGHNQSSLDGPGPELELIAGRALFAGGRLAEAKAAFETAIASSSQGGEIAAQAQWRIGETLLIQEKYVEAITAYLLTIERYSHPHWRSAALLQAGKCHERIGNLSEALKFYKQLEREYPASEFATQARRRIDAVERRAGTDELIRR